MKKLKEKDSKISRTILRIKETISNSILIVASTLPDSNIFDTRFSLFLLFQNF